MDRERNAAIVLRGIELGIARDDAWSTKRPTHVALQAPYGYHDPVTGRRELQPDPQLVALGRHLRRARSYADYSQQRLADHAGVTQSMISRAERALAPAMGVDRLSRIGYVLGRTFPLGFCPHDHDCAWQPISPRKPDPTRTERLIELMLGRPLDPL